MRYSGLARGPSWMPFQAEWLNVHVDFPLLQRLAHPITIGAVRYPGLKIHEARVVRLFEVLLHGGTQIGRPGRSIKPSSTPSTSLTRPTT